MLLVKAFIVIVIVFAALRLLVLLVNLLTFKRLSETEIIGAKNVAVLIPARNEEDNIKGVLSDLTKQTFSRFKVFVYDDLSEDQTSDVVSGFQRKYTNFKLIKGNVLPLGWGGKNYACYQLAAQTNADILVFLDADVRISANFLEKVISSMQKNKLKLLSIFPVQITRSLGEKIVVPLFNWILLTLLPLILIEKSSWESFSAANGQCMIFDGKNYRMNQWHELKKNAVVEDIAIMRAMKKRKYKVGTLVGQKEICCRMYHSFTESFIGVARSAPAFFGNTLLWALFFLLVVLVGPVLLLLYLDIFYVAYFILFVVCLRILVALVSRVNVWQMLLLHIPQMIILPFVVMKGFSMRYHKSYIWKNRKLEL